MKPEKCATLPHVKLTAAQHNRVQHNVIVLTSQLNEILEAGLRATWLKRPWTIETGQFVWMAQARIQDTTHWHKNTPDPPVEMPENTLSWIVLSCYLGTRIIDQYLNKYIYIYSSPPVDTRTPQTPPYTGHTPDTYVWLCYHVFWEHGSVISTYIYTYIFPSL